MKGIVFTEFLEMVEEQFSLEIADRVIQNSGSATDGAYTSAGTYDHQELVQMVFALSKLTNIPVLELIKAFGQHVFRRFTVLFPVFFEAASDAFTFLESVENYIHVEVRKLYLDAELPSFDCERVAGGKLKMLYKSSRHLADLAEGMIQACCECFQENISIAKQDSSSSGGAQVEFLLSVES